MVSPPAGSQSFFRRPPTTHPLYLCLLCSVMRMDSLRLTSWQSAAPPPFYSTLGQNPWLGSASGYVFMCPEVPLLHSRCLRLLCCRILCHLRNHANNGAEQSPIPWSVDNIQSHLHFFLSQVVVVVESETEWKTKLYSFRSPFDYSSVIRPVAMTTLLPSLRNSRIKKFSTPLPI